MEKSERFGFNLPSRDGDDIADINKISDNFRIIDGEMATNEDVKEIVDTKANLEFVDLEIEELAYVSGLKEGAHIYELEKIIEAGSSGAYELYFTDGTQLITSAHDSFKVGKKYLISTTLDPETGYVFDIVAEVIDLKDKVNIEDIDQTYNPESPNAQSGIAVAEALASVPSGGSGEYILLCETTITAEDISEAGENGITRLVVGGEEEQFKGVRELVLDLYMPANDQKNFKFYAGFSTDGTSNIYGANLIGGHTDGILPIDTTKITRTKLVTILNGSGKFMYSLLIRSSYGSSVYPNPSVGCVSYIDETAGMGNCNYIYCNGGGFKFPEGTIFKVYGRY